jgi:predicted kinase
MTERLIERMAETAHADAMRNCMQDAEWHAEGDVWTHTLMVCEQVEKLEVWPTLDDASRFILIYMALFHDSGKPQTTFLDPESGRLRSPGHSRVGGAIARSLLREWNVNLLLREQIVNGVLFHGRPMNLGRYDDPLREVIHTSGMISNALLYQFALADLRGRIGVGMSEDQIEYWKLACEEAGCFDRPYHFSSEHARVLFYRGEPTHLGYEPYFDPSCTVYMMSGVPGSGKSTWIHAMYNALPVVSLDEIRTAMKISPDGPQGAVINRGKELSKEHLRKKQSFVLDATNLTRDMRKRWLDLFYAYNARVEITYLEAPLAETLERNAGRERQVPESVIRRLMERAEPPTVAEAHVVRVIDSAALIDSL